MLRSIIFLLVMISLITTPTRAYEAYNLKNLSVLQQQKLKQRQEQELKNIPQSVVKDEKICHFETGKAWLQFFKKEINTTQREAKAQNIVIRDDICGMAVTKAEKDYLIKPELLHTIASVESGIWSKKYARRIAWPWTVQANGKGYYYQSKEEAVAAIKVFLEEGNNNIDVGCMQINLKYHGHAFKNIEEALDPEKNVAYSAKFLRKLYKENGEDWQKTAMQYHSKNYEKGMTYKERLETHYAQYIKPTSAQTLF